MLEVQILVPSIICSTRCLGYCSLHKSCMQNKLWKHQAHGVPMVMRFQVATSGTVHEINELISWVLIKIERRLYCRAVPRGRDEANKPECRRIIWLEDQVSDKIPCWFEIVCKTFQKDFFFLYWSIVELIYSVGLISGGGSLDRNIWTLLKLTERTNSAFKVVWTLVIKELVLLSHVRLSATPWTIQFMEFL